MTITLYNSSAEDIRLDKSNYLSKILSLEGTLRERCSILQPSILLNIYDYDQIIESNQIDVVDSTPDDIIMNLVNKIIGCNYAYIPEFNRYYFVQDIISESRFLWRLNLSCDTLMSFKDEILSQEAFVARNENTYSDMIKDDLVSYYYDKDITEYVPDNGAKVNYTFSSTISVLKNNYTITVQNDLSDSSVTSVNSPSTALPNVGGWVTGSTAMSVTYTTYNAQIAHLANFILKDNNRASFIYSIIVYPFEIPVSSNTAFYLTLGTEELEPIVLPDPWGTAGVEVYNLKNQFSDYMVIADFTITADSFLDYSPYAVYDIYIPYLGWVNLDADLILNNRLLVVYTCDYKTGSAQVSIIDDTNSKIIYTTRTQLGVQVPVTTTNALEVENNKINNNVGLGLGLTASAISIIGGIASMNPVTGVLGVASGALSASKSIANFVSNNNTNYSRASGSVGSGNSGVYLPQTVKVRVTRLKPKNYDSNYASLVGKPLNSYETLSNLTGYTQVGEAHLEGFSNATKSELQQIESLLKSGIII